MDPRPSKPSSRPAARRRADDTSPTEGTLVQPVGAAGAPREAFLGPPQQPDEIGRLGPYRILSELGRGGMGAVFRAEDPRLQREVAIKVLLPELSADARAKARFRREAQAQARVEDDHIIPIHEVGETDGVAYIVMPLLKGQTLAAALKQNPRPPVGALVRIAREVALGLAAAHAAGLIHRDIKPSNVWLEGARRRVKILDFGLARATGAGDAAAPEGEPITSAGAVMGTAAYMSPEQARSQPADHRSDLFSLGVILFEMATGEKPFNGPSPFDVMTAVVSHEPPPVRMLVPEVPPALSELIRRLLAKRPAARPASAATVAEELEAIERGLTVPPVQVFPLGSVPGEPDPWAEIVTTQMQEAGEPEEDAPHPRAEKSIRTRTRARPAPRPATPKWLWPAVGLGALLVVAVVAVAATKFKQPKQELVETPNPPPAAPAPKDPKKEQRNPELAAARWVLDRGGEVKVRAGDKSLVVKPGDKLPPSFQLTNIVLQGKNCANEDLPRFRGLPALVELHLGGTKVTSAGLAQLTGLEKLSALWLGGCQGIDDEAIRYLGQLPQLNSVDLGRTGVGDGGVRELVKLRQLTVVYLSGSKVTAAGVAELAQLPELGILHLSGLPVGNEELRALSGCTKLVNLALQDTRVTDEGLKQLEPLAELRHLDLTGTRVTADGVAALKKAIPKCEIAWDGAPGPPAERAATASLRKHKFTLVLAAPGGKEVTVAPADKLPDEPFELLDCNPPAGALPAGFWRTTFVPAVANLSKFRGVLDHAMATPWFEDDLAALASAPVAAHLMALRGDFPLTAKNLEALKKLPKLEDLGCRVGPGSALVRLKELPKLDWLVLHAPADKTHPLTAEEWAGLPAERLRGLELYRIELNAAAAKRLAAMPKLESLGLVDCPGAATALPELAACPALRELILHGDLTDADLAPLEKFAQLRRLTLRAPKVTDAAVEKLAQKLPACRIEWGAGKVVEPGKAPPAARASGLVFDGKATCVKIPTLKFDGKFPVTIEAWITPASVGESHICLLGEPGGGMGISRDGALGVGFYDGKDWHPVYGGQLKAGQKVHVAAVVTKDQTLLFIDGKQVASPALKLGPLPATKPPAVIGKATDAVGGGGHFHGTMHGLRVSNSARYAKDFAPPAKLEADAATVALYLFDEGKGAKLTDRSKNKHDGTIENGTWAAPKK